MQGGRTEKGKLEGFADSAREESTEETRGSEVGQKTPNKTSSFPESSQLVLGLFFNPLLSKSGAGSAKGVFLSPLTPASSCFLQLELQDSSKTQFNYISKKKRGGWSVNMTPFYLLIHLDKQTMC